MAHLSEDFTTRAEQRQRKLFPYETAPAVVTEMANRIRELVLHGTPISHFLGKGMHQILETCSDPAASSDTRLAWGIYSVLLEEERKNQA